MLVPIIVGCGPLGGRSVVTVSLPGRGSQLRRVLLDELLILFRYLPRSATALLQGTLPLRYCAGRFASMIPTWRLAVDRNAAGLVTGVGGEVGLALVEHISHAPMPGFEGGGRVDWIVGPGGGVKRARLNRKTPAKVWFWGNQSRPRVWKRLRVEDHSGRNHADAKARHVDIRTDNALTKTTTTTTHNTQHNHNTTTTTQQHNNTRYGPHAAAPRSQEAAGRTGGGDRGVWDRVRGAGRGGRRFSGAVLRLRASL